MQKSLTLPLACPDISSLLVLSIIQLVLSSEHAPQSHQNKPWILTHPHDIVESPGIQDSTGEVKSVEGFSQGAVTMTLKRKNTLGHVLADLSPDSTRPDPEQLDLAKLMGTNHGSKLTARRGRPGSRWAALTDIKSGHSPMQIMAASQERPMLCSWPMNLLVRMSHTFLGFNI